MSPPTWKIAKCVADQSSFTSSVTRVGRCWRCRYADSIDGTVGQGGLHGTTDAGPLASRRGVHHAQRLQWPGAHAATGATEHGGSAGGSLAAVHRALPR